MAFCLFLGFFGGGLLEFKKGDSSSSVLIHSIFNHTGKTLALVPGTGAERGRKQCLEFVQKKKKLESFPHVKLKLSSSSSQMSCYGCFNVPLFKLYKKISNIYTIFHQIM